jgi:hypothetical protein
MDITNNPNRRCLHVVSWFHKTMTSACTALYGVIVQKPRLVPSFLCLRDARVTLLRRASAIVARLAHGRSEVLVDMVSGLCCRTRLRPRRAPATAA